MGMLQIQSQVNKKSVCLKVIIKQQVILTGTINAIKYAGSYEYGQNMYAIVA